MRFVLFFLLFAVTAARAQESPNNQTTQLKQLIDQFSSGDTAALPAIEALLASSRAQRKQAIALFDTLMFAADRLSKEDRCRQAIALERLGLSQATSLNDIPLTTYCLVGLAHDYLELDALDSAQHFIDILMNIPASEWSPVATIALENISGLMAKKQGRHLQAIEHYWNALDLGIIGPEQKGVIHQNLAALFSKLGHHRRSIHYNLQALTVFQQQNDTLLLSDIHTNLGVSWMHLDSLKSAAYHHLASLDHSTPNTFKYARGLANYGNVLRRQGKTQEAIAAIDSSMRICARLDIPFGVALNQVNRAHVLLNMQKPAEAIEQLRASESFEPVAQTFKTEICSLYFAAYKAKGDQSAAFKYLQRYVTLKDSLERAGSDHLVLDWEEQIIRTRKEKELETLNQQLEETRQRQRLMLLAVGMVLLLAAAGGRIIFLQRQQERLNARLTEEAHENIRLQLEAKERELTEQAIHLQALGSFTEDIGGKLKRLKDDLQDDQAETLGKIIREFQEGVPDEIWEGFRERFEQVHDRFHQQLLQICPDLSPVELRIASYLRLNLSSKEISRLTNRSVGTISNTRSALRKKLCLEEEDNLIAFLMSI